MNVRLTKSFEFDCAHYLPCFAEGHKCRNMHGHTMRLDVVLEGAVPDGRDYLIDFAEIKNATQPIIDQLDHKLLNDLDGLVGSPTVENLCKWVWDMLKPNLPYLLMVRIYETPTNICEYRG